MSVALTAKFHPLANLFPLMEGEDFTKLVEDIRENGLRTPIVQHENSILDGRNRYRACIEGGVAARFETFVGEDALGYVLSANLHRRHLDASQRAMIAAKLSEIIPKHSSVGVMERWALDREVKEILDSPHMDHDTKSYAVSRLKAEVAKKNRLQGKRNTRQIYIAVTGDRMKVGVSSYPEFRIDAFKGHFPDIRIEETWPGGFTEETELHALLSDFHISGEWFKYSPEAMDICQNFMQTRKIPGSQKSSGPIKSAAKIMNVAERLVDHARTVFGSSVPEIVSLVERGGMAVSLAAQVAAMPPEVQRKVALQTEKEARGSVKKHMRAERETAQAEATQRASEAVGSQLFGVIMADPPWRFEPRSRTTGMDRSADNHYDTLTVDEVIALKGSGHVPAADDCVLFLWATVPMLLDAIDVLLGWDFEYRSHFVWVKEKIGTGYWNRNQHEILLIGTRGKVVAPAPGEQYSSVIEAKSLRHSEKPAIVAEMIEDMFPTQAKLEMFARTPRLGWTVWGNEVETTEA